MNDFFRARFKEWRGGAELHMGWEMAAGGCAGLCQVSATTPMERLQVLGATMADKLKTGYTQARTHTHTPALHRR
jgi:hypothetical protein